MEDERIDDLVSQLNDMRATNLTSLRTMMTFAGSQGLQHDITQYGQRFVCHLSGDRPVA